VASITGYFWVASNYWFYSSFDGTYIPYVITKEAVGYYSNLTDQFNANKLDSFFLTAEFVYSASVEFHENYQSPSTNSRDEQVTSKEFESVYVVKFWNGNSTADRCAPCG